MAHNEYSLAKFQVIFEIHDLPREWQRDGIAATKDLMNRAFAIYYRGWHFSIAASDMVIELAEKGHGWLPFGEPDDLREAMDYLADRDESPWWGYTSRETYSGLTKAPKSIVRFMKALQPIVKELQGGLEELDGLSNELASATKKDNLAQVKMVLEKAKGAAKLLNKYMWLAPAAIQEKVGPVLKKGLRYVDVLENVQKGAEAAALLTSGRTPQDRLLQTLEVVGMAVQYLPVLGKFYSKAIEAVVGIPDQFQEHIDRRKRILDDAANGLIRHHSMR